MQNELQRLLPRHYKILEMCLNGMSRTDIALSLEPPMTPEGVGLIINSPLFQDELARQRDRQIKADIGTRNNEAMEILLNAASKAAQKHVDLLNSPSERIAQSSANAILEKVMGSKDNTSGGVVKLDQAVINLLQITIQEIKDHNDANVIKNIPVIERFDIELD